MSKDTDQVTNSGSSQAGKCPVSWHGAKMDLPMT